LAVKLDFVAANIPRNRRPPRESNATIAADWTIQGAALLTLGFSPRAQSVYDGRDTAGFAMEEPTLE